MSKKPQRTTTRERRQAAQLRRLGVLDALRGLGLELIAGAMALAVWVGVNAELVAQRAAMTIAGGLLLLVMLHLGVRDFLSERTPPIRAAGVALFAVLWAGVMFIAYSDVVNLPPPILQTDLKPAAPPATVPLHGASGPFRVVVEGHFPPTHEAQTAPYRISVGQRGASPAVLEGQFTERWTRRRLGRRGSVQQAIVHSINQHVVESPAGDDFTLHLDEIGLGVNDWVTVSVYPPALPVAMLAVLEAALVGGAVMLDSWREAADGALTISTLAAVGLLAAFRAFAAARPGFGDLIVFGGAGALAGGLSGSLLWRTARRALLRPAG